MKPSPAQIAKRIVSMLLVGGLLLWFLHKPKEGNLVNDLLKQFSSRVLSNLAGVE